jgi:hypothetical protein
VVHGNPAFCRHFFQIAVAERIAQIPSDAQNDNDVLEVSSSIQRRPGSGHGPPYQIQPRRLQHIRSQQPTKAAA